jgi:hypothetical protein
VGFGLIAAAYQDIRLIGMAEQAGEKSGKQILRGLKPARNEKIKGLTARLKRLRKKSLLTMETITGAKARTLFSKRCGMTKVMP